MARVQFGGGITDIAGSIGGNTFQTNRSGNIIRSRGFTRKSITAKQVISLNAHQGLLYAWQNLSFADKQSWDVLSLSHPKVDKYGRSKTLTGLNWFCSCNQARILCGLTLFSTAPTYVAPSSVPNFTVTVDISGILLEIDTPQTITDNYMIVRATPPIRNKTTSFRSQLKYIQNVNSDYWDDVDITSSWETATGLSWPPSTDLNSFQIGVMIQSVDITSGITSEGLRFINTLI